MTYIKIILTIMTVMISYGVFVLCGIHNSIIYDYRSEKVIHFNRWYDVSMFKGTQLNITENKSEDVFEGEEDETKNS